MFCAAFASLRDDAFRAEAAQTRHSNAYASNESGPLSRLFSSATASPGPAGINHARRLQPFCRARFSTPEQMHEKEDPSRLRFVLDQRGNPVAASRLLGRP